VEGQEWGSGVVPPVGCRVKDPGRGLEDKVRAEADDTFCENMPLLF